MEAKTEEILTQRISELERKLDDANEKNECLQREVDGSNWGWMLIRGAVDRPGLLVPRLELEWTKVDDYNTLATYRLVVQHLVDGLESIPLGCTKVHGYSRTDWPPEHGGKLDLPFREGAHIHHDMMLLGIPAYVICGDRVDQLPYGNNYSHAMQEGLAHRKHPSDVAVTSLDDANAGQLRHELRSAQGACSAMSKALRDIAETVGGKVDENASVEFHCLVANEVKLHAEKLNDTCKNANKIAQTYNQLCEVVDSIRAYCGNRLSKHGVQLTGQFTTQRMVELMSETYAKAIYTLKVENEEGQEELRKLRAEACSVGHAYKQMESERDIAIEAEREAKLQCEKAEEAYEKTMKSNWEVRNFVEKLGVPNQESAVNMVAALFRKAMQPKPCEACAELLHVSDVLCNVDGRTAEVKAENAANRIREMSREIDKLKAALDESARLHVGTNPDGAPSKIIVKIYQNGSVVGAPLGSWDSTHVPECQEYVHASVPKARAEAVKQACVSLLEREVGVGLCVACEDALKRMRKIEP